MQPSLLAPRTETQFNSYTTSSQSGAQITALSDGGWVITWQSWDQGRDSLGIIYAQAYNSDGTAQGGEMQVNNYTTSTQSGAQITALSDGGWLITWQSYFSDGSSYGTYAQAYNSDGTAQGGEMQVNTNMNGAQQSAQITALNDGGWVITWMSTGQHGSSFWSCHAYVPVPV
jgi:hypothetical protein